MGGIASGFEGHGICAGSARYFNTLWDSFVNQWEAEGTAHPNRAGQQVYAQQIIRALAADLYPGLPTQALPTAGMDLDRIRDLWISSDGPLAFPTRIGRIPGGVTPGSQPPPPGEDTGDEEPASSLPGGVSTAGEQSEAEGSLTAEPTPTDAVDTTSPVAAPAATSGGSDGLLLLAVISAALGATLIAWAIHRRTSLAPAPTASQGTLRPKDAAGDLRRFVFAPCPGCGRSVNQELEFCPYCHADPSTGT